MPVQTPIRSMLNLTLPYQPDTVQIMYTYVHFRQRLTIEQITGVGRCEYGGLEPYELTNDHRDRSQPIKPNISSSAVDKYNFYIGGSRGGGALPLRVPNSFRFDIQNFRNVTASGVHTPPPRGPTPPPTGNPGSATVLC